ncbi:glycoside hydrolase family 16 protein [Tsukamurella sp. M9C]|uniref:glycoside hydrolase family 16 protein n=1 Tax=unclassified Tsukamurella TaxID=2633480 RepID=UPI001CCFE246|nr:glycoside hydrolase family 16 protein [Tsukamurella sp. M9C]MCA0157456.1 glycoside hydrolase family 16 protein [Tsukamurella sp. M9C]
MEFRETFDRLDPTIWTDSYLPAWSSRAAARATVAAGPDGLTLSIPPEQGPWCPDTHPTPLRVSGIHSANRSGPVGSTDAPQPFLPGQTVQEEQATRLGFAPHFGGIAVTCSAVLTPRSMFAAWMVGLEDRVERCGEICLVEVFGDAIEDGIAAVGQGIHRFRDPALTEDFSAERHAVDVSRPHTYRADWEPGRVTFSIDGTVTRVSPQAPDYPMMLILGIFDFPDRVGDPAITPSMTVSAVTGTGLGPATAIRS